MVIELFSLNETSTEEVNSRSEEVISNAIELIDSLTDKSSDSATISWALNKVYQSTKNTKTNTYKARINNELWASRFSVIDCGKEQIKYSDFLYSLTGATKNGDDYSISDPYTHTAQEVHYISVLKKWEKGDSDPIRISKTEDSSFEGVLYDVEVRYYFGSPLNHRHFSEVILITLPIIDETSETSYVISFPKSNGKKIVSTDTNAYYCSVEKIKYNKSKNQIEWSMGTASNAGGNLPRWLQNMSVCKSVSEDVPSYLNYLKSLST